MLYKQFPNEACVASALPFRGLLFVSHIPAVHRAAFLDVLPVVLNADHMPLEYTAVDQAEEDAKWAKKRAKEAATVEQAEQETPGAMTSGTDTNQPNSGAQMPATQPSPPALT